MDERVRDAFRRAFRAASRPQANGEPLDWERNSLPGSWCYDDGKMLYDWSEVRPDNY